MDTKKIKYTVSWTERPENWNIPGAVKLLKAVRCQVITQEQRLLEEMSIRETNTLIERLTCKK